MNAASGNKGAKSFSATGKLTTDERAYLISLERLYQELKKAKEQDFDAHLSDGLGWSKSALRRLERAASKKNGNGSANASPSCEKAGSLSASLEEDNEDEDGDFDPEDAAPRLAPGAVDKNALPGLIERIKKHRNSGHKGRAIDRDLGEATRCAGLAKQRWQEMERAWIEAHFGGSSLSAFRAVSSSKKSVSKKEAEAAVSKLEKDKAHIDLQRNYISWIVKLLVELQREGEPDFDGMLRNALNFLENGGRKVTY